MDDAKAPSRSYPFATVDVFTEQRFGGNPLAVVTDARGISDTEMQALAAEFNYSETTFVLPPDNPANTAKVRIFNRTYEMPFAGHPNVGTGYVLASQGTGQGMGDVMRFEELAGVVEVRIDRDPAGSAVGATIAAPQALSLGPELPIAGIAACVGLEPAEIVVRAHPPRAASVGVSFVVVEVAAAALARATPSLDAFNRQLAAAPDLQGRLSIHLYAHDGEGRLRARMFAPPSGTVEDPATGSANAALAALLLSLGTAASQSFDIVQGVEMGRPSLLHAAAHRANDGIRATVRGRCVPVLRGEVVL
jgi:trans-2,3-dihydro-3-hydroxyanthranilate isomerase